jgi:hypothetical protein
MQSLKRIWLFSQHGMGELLEIIGRKDYTIMSVIYIASPVLVFSSQVIGFPI